MPSDLAYTVTTAQPVENKDSTKALEAFFYTCLHAGPTNCSFAGTSSTTAELRARFDAVDTALKTHPIPVDGSPVPFTWSIFRTFLSIALHTAPYFPVLGGVLAEAEMGGAVGWIPYAMFNVTLVPPAPRPFLDETAPLDGVLSGVCIDAQQGHHGAAGNFDAYLAGMFAAAPAVAPLFADWRLVCSKWAFETENKFPLGHLGQPVKTNGSILVVNNVADPACSLEGAESVVDRFSPSYLVKNNAAGHTTFTASGPCLFGYIYQFFVLGMTPAPGSECAEIDPKLAPFGLQLPATL